MDNLNKLSVIFLAVLFVVLVHTDSSVIICESSENSIELQPYVGDCQKFVVCVHNVGTAITCPNGLYFDQQRKECQPENTCENPENPVCDPECVDNESGWVASNKNCYDYVECKDSCNAEYKSCSAGLHFNPIRGKCDSADHAECILEVCSFNDNGMWEIMGSVNSCSKYYFCFGREAMLRICGKGTVFSPESLQCVLESSENKCNENRPPFPDDTVIAQCTPDIEFMFIPDNTYEEYFYQCLNGILTVRRCPEGLIFDREIMMCNLPVPVEPSKRTTVV